ncbi:3-oxoadipate enol-lactonase [Myxococcaceae bacterium]|jgi:2-succinyl-6-hydroxy-2,4-cyclohexadiene-1-carboxylate synthase|nr:3-oxoadipate enol-lactonase [Myxococcaceae bacterium]
MPTSKCVYVNGIEIRYDEAGSGERPFVLVHGFTGCRDDFSGQLPGLATLGRTLAPDQRGHGESTNTGERSSYHLAQLVDDLAAFLDATGVERCDLLGHSMGGMVALRFALAHPDRVLSLVAMDTAPAPLGHVPREMFEKGGEIARAAGMEKLHQILRERAAENPARTPADRRLEKEWGERYWQRHRMRLTSMDPEAFVALGIALSEQESLVERLGEIRCPTLVMVGAEDAAFLDPANVMERAIPNARRITIPNAGHSPQIETPAAWFEAIRAHLERVRSA